MNAKIIPWDRLRLCRERMRQWALEWRRLSKEGDAEMAHEVLLLAIGWRNRDEVLRVQGSECRVQNSGQFLFLGTSPAEENLSDTRACVGQALALQSGIRFEPALSPDPDPDWKEAA